MYVKDNMAYDPITLKATQSVSEALDVMSENGFRRLPVVDDNGKLIGIITESIISSNTPNNTSTLSVFELNYLLNKLTIGDIMIKDVITTSEDALLEEAATIMNKNSISCLPVVKENNKLVGIITHMDIFKAFIELLGYNHSGIRYVINVTEDKPGILASVAEEFKAAEISISNLAVYHTSRGIEVVVISKGFHDISEQLKTKGFNITSATSLHSKD